jgi:general secretion pathway protein N
MTALRIDHALAAGAVCFAALAIWPWLVPPIPAARPRATPPVAPAASPVATLPPLASFAATVERPLFSPSRRPAANAPAAAAPGAESRYRLLGIVASGPKKTAFIADGARRAEIGIGDAFDGWTVKEIGQNRVTLASPSGEMVLKLKSTPVEPAKPQ